MFRKIICNAIELFKHIEDKALFSEIYINQLATRLLNHASANEDAEKSMISKMKECCGSRYTYKMEKMLSNIKESDEIKRDYSSTPSSLPIIFSVQLIDINYWPYTKENFNSMQSVMKASIDQI